MHIKTVIRSAMITGLAAAFVLTANVQAASVWVQTYQNKNLNGTYLLSQIVTQDGTDQAYNLKEVKNKEGQTTKILFTTPTENVGGNTREFFWPANSLEGRDQLSCAVWTQQTGEGASTQQGAVLRMHQGEGGGTRAISVMKNIWFGATWMFNVHVWDTSNTQAPYTQVGSFDMSEVTGKVWWQDNADGTRTLQSTLKPFPWHFCARTMGDKLQFKVWTNELEKQPSWNDPKYVREMAIPESHNQPGIAGWYIGHLKPGHTATFQNLSISHRVPVQ